MRNLFTHRKKERFGTPQRHSFQIGYFTGTLCSIAELCLNVLATCVDIQCMWFVTMKTKLESAELYSLAYLQIVYDAITIRQE